MRMCKKVSYISVQVFLDAYTRENRIAYQIREDNSSALIITPRNYNFGQAHTWEDNYLWIVY